MEPFGHLDFMVYFLVLYYYIVRDLGLFFLIKFWLNNFPATIIYNYINNRIWLPFPYQSLFNQKATNAEYIFVELIKYYIDNLSTTTRLKSIFFDGRIFKVMNQIRRWRYCSDGLGDIVCNDIGKGIWVYSDSRIDLAIHDVGIFYIHAGLSCGGSGDMYGEYLSILTMNLLQQGFENPGVFIPTLMMQHDLDHLLQCYQHFQTHFQDNIIIMADSLGAKLALALLIKISQNKLIKPKLAILISPIINNTNQKSNDDYINHKILNQWNKKLPNFPQFSTLSTTELESILPNLLISYGSEEYLAPDIESFIHQIQQTSIKIRIDCYKGRLHNWPILSFYTERFIDKREFTLQFYSSFIARVMLGDSFYKSAIIPTNINTRDEGYT